MKKIDKRYIKAALQGACVGIGIVTLTAFTGTASIFWWIVELGFGFETDSLIGGGLSLVLLGLAYHAAYVLLMVCIFTTKEWIFARMQRLSLL